MKEKIKQFFVKYWPLIGLIISFLIERSLGIFSWMGMTPDQADFAKAFGALIYGYFFTSKFNIQSIGLPKPPPRPENE